MLQQRPGPPLSLRLIARQLETTHNELYTIDLFDVFFMLRLRRCGACEIMLHLLPEASHERTGP
ncbi:MAG: hypothetical protein AB7O69_13925, partial [Burkholderiales bacterium]